MKISLALFMVMIATVILPAHAGEDASAIDQAAQANVAKLAARGATDKAIQAELLKTFEGYPDPSSINDAVADAIAAVPYCANGGACYKNFLDSYPNQRTKNIPQRAAQLICGDNCPAGGPAGTGQQGER
jgi:hypothetical protein